jgi:hypothetical protein
VEVRVRLFAIAVIWTGVIVGLGAASVQSQSLGEVAAKEKERRKGDTTRVVTEDDLTKHKGSAPTATPAEGTTASSTGDSRSAAAASATPGGKSEEDVRAEARKDWEQRRQRTEQEIDQLTKQAEDLQRAVGDPRTVMYGPNRARAAEQHQQAQDKLAAARQRLDDLDEERRRQGY